MSTPSVQMVQAGSLRCDPAHLRLRFALTDGKPTIAVERHGTPPDLFREGVGAVVEGTWHAAGYLW